MSKRDEYANKAVDWMYAIKGNEVWQSAIDSAVASTEMYIGGLVQEDDKRFCLEHLKERDTECNISISPLTTYGVLDGLMFPNIPVCILNFASYYNPGGGFMKGSMAQEESLCAVSGLYNILFRLSIYSQRRACSNTPPAYNDELIYNPRVPFTIKPGECSKPYWTDVVSVSAPNLNRMSRYTDAELKHIYKRRLEAVYIQAYLHACDALILGAWGCGVFKNDPRLVAEVFKELNDTYGNLFREIIFAMPNKEMREIFADVLYPNGNSNNGE